MNWFFDNGGIDQGAFLEQDTRLRQPQIDFVKELLSQSRVLQQVAELHTRGVAQCLAGKQTHRGKAKSYIASSIARSPVCLAIAVIPLLYAMNPAHDRQRIRSGMLDADPSPSVPDAVDSLDYRMELN